MRSIGTLRRSASSAGAAADSPPPAAPPPAADAPRPSSNRKRWITGGVVVVVVAAGLGTYLGTRSSNNSASASPIVQTTETVSVTTGTIKQSVATSGTLEPGEDDSLNFQVAGQVNSVDVTSGQTVQKGQKLATLDATALNDDVAAAESTVTAAQDKLTTDTDDSAPSSQIDSDQSSVNAAENSLTSAKDDLADATLTSPISGTIASVNLTVGEEVSGSGSGSSGSGASSSGSSSSSSSSGQITVINTGTFTVSASVSDTQIGGIKVGDQAVINPSGSTSTIYGVVSSVGLIANDSSDVASFPVTINVTGSPTGVYAGSTATVSIITKQLNNVIEVPTAAISYSNGSAQVTEVTGSGKKTVNITTGASANGETQVTSGLKVGDKIQETLVKFNRSALTSGSGRSLFGNSSTRGARNFSGGNFPGGGLGGGGGSGGGSGVPVISGGGSGFGG